MSLYVGDRMILDLCAGSGAWSEPYKQAGYRVVRVELKDGGDVRLWPSRPCDHARLPREFDDVEEWIGRVWGVLAAPVCTSFSNAASRVPRTDKEMRKALALTDACIRIVHVVQPQWWAMENSVGKLRKWIGPPAWTFTPCDFGDPYTKRTLLWGRFRKPVRDAVPATETPLADRYGGKSERTKSLRSITPAGFAQAFFEANR